MNRHIHEKLHFHLHSLIEIQPYKEEILEDFTFEIFRLLSLYSHTKHHVKIQKHISYKEQEWIEKEQ